LRENTFLRTVGEDTYKFHDLFRDFLLRQLTERGELEGQHNKAGAYFFSQEDYYRSGNHYLKAENDDGVAHSIYHMYNYNSSYASVVDTLTTVSLYLSESVVEKHPFLLEARAWCAYVEGQSGVMEQLLDKYYKLLPKIILKSPRSAITQMFVRCMDYRINFVGMLKTLRIMPFKEMAKTYSPSITQNMPYFHRSGRDFSEIACDLDRNLAWLKKGFSAVFGDEMPVIIGCLQAGILFEKGNINEAQNYALSACASIQPNGSAEMKFCAMVIFTSSLFAAGQTASANKMLTDIEDMIKRDNAFYLIPNFRAYQLTLRLSDGDRNAANEWLSYYSESPHGCPAFYKLYRYFTTARAYIVMGENDMAILLLKKLLILAENYKRPLDIIEALILLAIAHQKKGKAGLNTAQDYLEKAAAIAHKYKYTQIFANEGAELTTMLHRFQKRAAQSSYAGDVPSDFVKALYIATVAGAKQFKGLTGGRLSKNLTFTDKQKEVMRLMCAGLSRNEIAEKMGLKPYGVKSHTTLIYNKLNVSNSIEAVLRIRALGLLNA